MSLWDKPSDPINWKPMGGEASLGEIMASSFEAGRLAHSSIAESESIEQAFDDRIDTIREATGVVMTNPYRAALPRAATLGDAGNQPVGAGAEIYLAKVQDEWQRQLNSLAEKYPDAYDAIAPGRAIVEDANRIRREAGETSARDFASRPGLLKYGAAFAGGIGAAMRDPVQSALLILGGGPGAARTIGGRILEQAAMGAGINAATEAAVQPFVQSARAKAGLESGLGPALTDIGTAGLFGVVLGGGMQGAGEILGHLARRIRRPIADLPDDARGAASAIEADGALTAARPETMPIEAHDELAATAIAAAEDPGQIATFVADPALQMPAIGETRGLGRQFHGTSEPDLKPVDFNYSPGNIYGQGFYTTDAADIAFGYSKKGSARTGERHIYAVTENRPLKLLDMEQPVPDWLKTAVKAQGGLAEDALRQAPANLRELYDKVRELSAGYGMSMDEVQGLFDSLAYTIREHGFDGLTHRGGLQTGSAAHRVAIYFDPETTISVAKIDPARLAPKPGPPAKERATAPSSLFGFLASAGGLVDHAGELAAMGLDRTMVPRHGRLVRKQGLTLDHAREIAAEAGYLDHLYGSSEAAMAGSTINDLLDLLSAESHGSRAYTLADTLAMAEPKAPVDRRLAAKQRWVDGKLPDQPHGFRQRVADMIHHDGMDFDDAVEKAIMEDYYGGAAPEPWVTSKGEEVPFDEHLDRSGAGAERGAAAAAGTEAQPGRSGQDAHDGGSPGSAAEYPGSAGVGEATARGLSDLDALPHPAPLEAATPAAAAQTDALLATIEDPAAITIAEGVTLKSALDEVRHAEGVAGLIDACRLL